MRKLIATIVLALTAVTVSTASTTAAHADPTPAPAGLYVKRIDPAPAGPAITVTLSNGHRSKLTPCVYEDGRHCYWQATTRGNQIGRSFVVTGGHIYFVNLTGFNPNA